MASVTLVKTMVGLAPLNPNDADYVQSKKLGTVIEGNFKEMRNPQFHRKYFALLNLGFDYWEPVGGTVSTHEQKIIDSFVKFLGKHSKNQEALTTAADHFLQRISQQRTTVTIQSSFDSYRKWVAVEAGYFDVIRLPNGVIRKEAKSISFANMDEQEFEGLYKSSLNVLWNQILRFTHRSPIDVDNAVNQLLSYG